MGKGTSMTVKPITRPVPLESRFWQLNAIRMFLAISCFTDVFSIRMRVDVYRSLFMAYIIMVSQQHANANPVMAPHSSTVIT